VTAAIFGLIGVLAGGLITFGIEWWASRQERKRLQQGRAREVRASCRLVVTELSTAHSALIWAHREGKWWDESELEIVLWEQHRPLLAAELPRDEWKLVDVAYYAIGGLRRVRRLDDPKAHEISYLGRETVRGIEVHLLDAIEALQKYR
jgi:hypothetical protein